MQKQQVAFPKNLDRLYGALLNFFRKKLAVTNKRVEEVEKLLKVEEIDDNLLAILDASHRLIAYLDRNGRGVFPVGITSRDSKTDGDSEVGGKLKVKGLQIEECDDYGLYYILDKDNHILFMIDREGNSHFKGIPEDVKTEFEKINRRLDQAGIPPLEEE